MTLTMVIAAAFAYFSIASTAFLMAALWVLFQKAGEPGWAALIPIYNTYVTIKIAGRPWWWLILFLLPVPFLAVILAIILMFDLARNFGKGMGFGLGLAFLGFIFLPILAFGEDQYVGDTTTWLGA